MDYDIIKTTEDSHNDEALRLAALRDRLMQLVDERVAPTGIFHWSTLYPHAIAEYNGSSDARPMTQPLFLTLYHELATGALPSVTMASASDVEARAAAHRERGVIPIAIANYEYTTARRRFVATVLRHAKENTPLDIPDVAPDPAQLKDVIETRRAFFASALLKQEFVGFIPQPIVYYGLSARFEIPPDCYLSNTNSQLTGIEIDLDDGAGWRPVTIGTEVATRYKVAGTKHIFLRAQLDGRELLASFDMEVSASTAPTPNETWKLKSPLPPINGTTPTGHAWVFFGAGNTKLTEPMLIAEGFPGGYSLDFLWDSINKYNLGTDLLASGKDIVIVGFDEGTFYMEGNAGVVIDAINTAASEVKAGGGTPHLVVGGASMGGVVSCYALTYMEANNMDHYADKYFSIDSPHTGAFVPYSVQLFVNFFAKHNSDVAKFQTLLQSPASQELLNIWVDSDNSKHFSPSPLRTQFSQNLMNLGGHPKRPKKFGVADGDGNGFSNGVSNGKQGLHWSEDCAGAELYTAPGFVSGDLRVMAKLSYVSGWKSFGISAQDNMPNCESAPGGTTPTYEETAKALNTARHHATWSVGPNCFIPTISALAMAEYNPYTNSGLFQNVSQLFMGGGGTWLDKFTYSYTSDQQHVAIDATLAGYLYGNLNDQTVFVVNEAGHVWSLPHGELFPFDGKAQDIGVSPDGTMWIIGNEKNSASAFIYSQDRSTGKWQKNSAPANAISICGFRNEDTALAVDSEGRLLRLMIGSNPVLIPCPHLALDAGCNTAGQIWIISNEPRKGGYIPYYRLTGLGPAVWKSPSDQAAATRLAVLPDGSAMMINDIGQVYRVETNGSGKHYPGVVASDIGVGRDGTVWVISDKKLPGGFALCRLDWKTGKWIELPEPAAAVKVAVL